MPDDGVLVYSSWCSIDNIHKSLPRAVIAAEDNNFFEHNGFDIDAIKKAIEYNKRHKNKRRGASTISQQTAKNVFCIPSRSWIRKGFESYFTILIEPLWGKRRILEVYLNIVETHANVYGAEATADMFYKKSAAKLNIYESSTIVAVFPNPRRFNIGAPSPYIRNRSGRIRSLMGMLGPIEY